MTAFFGQPFVTKAELLTGSDALSMDELELFLVDGPMSADVLELTPVSRAWPMGFAWSSFVAQSYMVSCVVAAGFDADLLLTEEGNILSAGDSHVSHCPALHRIDFCQLSRQELTSRANWP